MKRILDKLFKEVENKWGELDFVVHAIAYSDKNELTGRYIDTSADNFKQTMFISCYTFTAIAARAEKIMKNGAHY